MLSDILNNATIMAPNVPSLMGIPVVIIVLEQPREATAWTLVLDLHMHLETTEALRIDFVIIMDLIFNFLLTF